MNRLISVIFRKESKEMLRDRRALIAIASYVFGIPLLMAFLMFLMADGRAEDAKTSIAVDGMAQGAGLVAYLEREGFVVKEAQIAETPTNLPEGADALIVLSADFSDDLSAGRAADLWLYVDETTRGTAGRGNEVKAALQGYANHIAGIRLIMRGIPPSILSPIAVVSADLSASSFFLKVMGNSVMLMFILAPFVVGLSVALDALAGERERHSLAMLLAQPVSANAITIGKWATVASFGLLGTLLTVSLDLVLLHFVPADMLPFTIKLTTGGFFVAVAQLAALCMFVAALQLTVSIHAKSFKEGQTYMSIMMMVPVIAGYAKIYGDSKLPPFVNRLPIFADIESLGRIFFDGVVNSGLTLSAMGASLLGTLLCLMLTARRLSSERMLAEA